MTIAQELPTPEEGDPEETSGAALPPSLQARYDDLKLLGRGGMGTVYRVHDKRLQRLAALKLLRRADPELLQSFLREARAQARVQHEHVCHVYEVGEADGEPFIVMQYIDGAPLPKVKDRMTLEQKVTVIRDIAAALHEAHRIGLVHRDVKPGNILVEAGDDGAWRPYIVDFGLARDVAERGQTMTGAVLGTPSFMAPEQARGEVRALDRRTDVYSLGATLYDLLAGRPPFVAEHLWKVLSMVADEEPPPLGAVMKEVPGELETIVMKCLEREPSKRYESARALGDDLQRFLDGEPIQARRAALGYVLWKRAKKHKLLALLTGAALVAAAVPLGLSIKARRDTAAQVALARELAEDVKEMELFLRTAYGLPLHDVEKERDIVRARLATIERRMAVAGKPGEGPGNYALGRGHLALSDPQKAREHLTRALEHGHTSPDLEVALGMALGELYRKALKETKRIENAEERAAKVRAIEAEYRDPALVHLRAARGSASGSPAYAEGLIAFYEERHEEALAKAKEAFEKAPWLYEAKKLEGDVQFVLGSRYRHDAAFDEEKMMAHFGPAAEAYSAAAEIARSDPEPHRAACELFTQVLLGAQMSGRPAQPSFEKARAACAKAALASSRDGQVRVQTAFTHAMFASSLTERPTSGDDPRTVIEEAIGLAEEAVRASPEDAMAHYVLGAIWCSKAIWLRDRGYDGRASFQRASAASEAALHIDPRFVWALQDLIASNTMSLDLDVWEGLDVTTGLERVTKLHERLIALAPDTPNAWYNKGYLHYLGAKALLLRGQSPEQHTTQMLAAADEIARLSPNGPASYDVRLNAYSFIAAHEIAAGKDPRRSLEEGARQAQELERRGGESASASLIVAEFLLTEARYHLLQSEDPEPGLRRAREISLRASKAAPWNVELLMLRAEIEILAIRWAMKQRRAKPEMFAEALGLLQPLVPKQHTDRRFYESLAELHALRAAWLLEGGRSPAEDIAQGLAMAGEALSKNPHMATALLARGDLFLTEARAAHDRGARAEAARRAAEAFEAAFLSNPLLEREHRAALEEAKRSR
jgi:eukaryotic-like serine/threonine-protein kinase